MKRIQLDLQIGIDSLSIGARDSLKTKYLGFYGSIFKGRGLEFDSYRNYTPNDDAAMIDWKASARQRQLMSRQYDYLLIAVLDSH